MTRRRRRIVRDATGSLPCRASRRRRILAILHAARRTLPALVVAPVVALVAPGARAQDLEPRAYLNLPVGLNFLVAGYGYTEGSVAFDPSVPLTDAHVRSNTAIFAYARALDFWGKSAKFDVVAPYSALSGGALYAGQPQSREITGFGDPRLRLSVNFTGAPALYGREFVNYRQDLIVGASLQVSPPLGQYDRTRLVNLGTNRWSVKSEIGVSKAWREWIFEVAPSVTFYTDNHAFLNGGTLATAPLYALQGHVVRHFPGGAWAALDGTWYAGGRSTTNGVPGDNYQRNTRLGAVFAFPLDRTNSIKLYASSGVTSRTGANFNAVGVAWQYRWGGGL